MVEEKEVPVVTVVLKESTSKPKMVALNLETMQEESIEIARTEYKLPETPKDVTEEDFIAAAFLVAQNLVGSVSDQVEALLRFASARTYAVNKDAALKGGKYLTKELANNVVTIMQGNVKFQEMSKSDVLDVFKKGVLRGAPGALRTLQLAQDAAAAAEMEF